MSLLKCVEALELARSKSWIDVKTFDAGVYRTRWNKYDVSWFVPGELELIADPVTTTIDPDPAVAKQLEPIAGGDGQNDDSFVSLFKADAVKRIVRMNLNGEPGLKESYDPAVFKKYGIEHLECSYKDVNGGVPKNFHIDKVIRTCGEAKKGEAIAFHCKAGFGRSAVCAAALVVYRHDVAGALVFPWLRMCRPGSVNTPEQVNFLVSLSNREAVEKFAKPMDDQPPCCVLA